MGKERKMSKARFFSITGFLIFLLVITPCYAQKILDFALGEQDVTLKGEKAFDECGHSLAMGDFNGDGLDDLIISAPRAGAAQKNAAGRAYVILGKNQATLPAEINLGTDVDFTIITSTEYEYMGASIAVGDVNGDSYDDILISAPLADGNLDREDSGEVYLIMGRSVFPDYVNVKTDADTLIEGIDESDMAGTTMICMDVNGDGLDDIILSASAANGIAETKEDSGEVYILLGRSNIPSKISLETFSDIIIYGQDAYDHFGNALAAGDLDGDGYMDLVATADLADGELNDEDQSGEVYVISKIEDFSGHVSLTAEAVSTVYGISAADRLGGALAILDINNDGHDDLVMNADRVDPRNRLEINTGQVYILFGGSPFSDITDLENRYDAALYGLDSSDQIGSSLAAGDLNGDGISDLIISVRKGDGPENNRSDSGEVYIIYGRNFLPEDLVIEQVVSTVVYGGHSGDTLGSSICTGRFDSDGFTDLILGAPKAVYGDRETNTGEVYMIRGGSKSFIITGTGHGQGNAALVKTFGTYDDLRERSAFLAYPSNNYGCNVAAGDLENDDVDEIVTGLGPGTNFPSYVRCYQFNGELKFGFYAYGVNKYGVHTATADLNGDGSYEILTGPGPGEVFGPHVRGWDCEDDTIVPMGAVNFIAYGTRKFGVHVGGGDVDGDGYAEIITGAGPGVMFGPHVRGFNYDGAEVTSMNAINFFAYGTRRFGVKATTGRVDEDAFAEILTTPGPGPIFGPHVRGWNYDGTAIEGMNSLSFFAYNRDLKYGANAACGDFDSDGKDEIITGPGPGPTYGSHIRGWNYDGGSLGAMQDISFLAYGSSTYYGANTAVGRFGL